jgi:hypothetical protein
MGLSSGSGEVRENFLNLNRANLYLNSTTIADLGRQRSSGSETAP